MYIGSWFQLKIYIIEKNIFEYRTFKNQKQVTMKKLFFIIVAISVLQACTTQSTSEYFGQTPPGDVPEIFAPGIISLPDRNEAMITFSPNGKECYFTISDKPWNGVEILESVFLDTSWATPTKASFIPSMGMCPSISADGSKFFFIGPYKGGVGVNQSTRTAKGGWSAPVEMDSLINSGSSEYSCHPSSLGSMFVCSWRAGGVGGCDGWRIPSKNGQYQEAQNMGALNSKVGDCLWAPGPNEEFLIFQSRRPATGNQGGFFETDLFITFAMPDGEWSAPQNLGPEINSSATDGFAWVSHDGKYLFFSSDRSGNYEIYWVSLDSVLKNTPRISLVEALKNKDDFSFYQQFDSKTVINFDVKKPGNIKLIIYNLDREELETIFDEYRPAGENQFVWEGEGYSKEEYLCKLQVSDPDSKQPFLESTIQVLLR